MLRLAAAATIVLGLLAGTARADTFAVVGGQGPFPAAPAGAEAPNAPGSLLLPAGWDSAPSVERSVAIQDLYALWRQAGAAYGIPWQVLAAINKIESDFGRNMGPSSAGAVGWMQFMPSTWLRWGTDADGDGVADPWNPADAINAAARYLAAAGGRVDLRRAVFAYNHADWYVRQVLDLANLYGGVRDGDLAFRLDRLQVALDEAQARVAGVNERLVAALRVKRGLARREASLLARARRASLLTDSLALQKRAGQVGVRLDRASARVRSLRAGLRDARVDLRFARARTQGAAFAPGGSTLFGTASYGGGYVFPVGGGPSAVSVGHDHHDYPAADIAAPAGSPVYALASGIVREAWSLPSGNCGIGFTIDTDDGQSWTYCHLSYLEPNVRPGVLAGAGAWVGLVGSTGHATGPHLHLQLDPTAAYPQDQGWFQSFAGTAFRWQDDPVPARFLAGAFSGPVFVVEQTPRVFAVADSTWVQESDREVLFTQVGG